MRINWELLIVWTIVFALGCTFWWGFFQLASMLIGG